MSSARSTGRARRVPAIVGPTAVGKTGAAIELAEMLGGEIVSADSRQIYRGMDIGTAKPTDAERARIPHHLIDIVEPSEIYDAARYAADAELAISSLIEAGKQPLVVGGTGFYLESLFEGLFVGPGRDDEARSDLEARAAAEGAPELHRELAQVDPDSALRIHPNDAVRIVRALEVYVSTGRTLTDWHSEPKRTPAFEPVYFGLRMNREALRTRIDVRVDEMMRSGLPDEVRALVESGRLAPGMPAADAVGYREILAAMAHGRSPASAANEIKTSTKRYAKRQMTWFGAIEGVSWIDMDETDSAGAAARAAAALRKAGAGPD